MRRRFLPLLLAAALDYVATARTGGTVRSIEFVDDSGAYVATFTDGTTASVTP